MNRIPYQRTSVSALIGTPVFLAGGGEFGRVREFAVSPLTDATRVEGLVMRQVNAARRARTFLPIAGLQISADGRLEILSGVQVEPMPEHDDFLLLERDLLDQQIIDVHGHKVVRVNDVDLVWESSASDGQETPRLVLRIAEVEVGTRGAVRRLLKGLPQHLVERIACNLRPVVIPWEFVDLIDRDPSRRVRLKIEQDRLSRMHPSDLADILEDLAPAEREALFSSLDEEVAAETLEEVDSKTQKRLIESLDSERVAGILDEMDPGAAADLLSELSNERSDAILEEMEDENRQEVQELLEYEPDSAAGLMSPEFVAVPHGSHVGEALKALEAFEGDLETVTEVFLVDAEGHLEAILPLSKLVLASTDRSLADMEHGHLVSIGMGASGRKVAELFDKYNLRALPVLDAEKRLEGVIRPEHVIAWLRSGR